MPPSAIVSLGGNKNLFMLWVHETCGKCKGTGLRRFVDGAWLKRKRERELIPAQLLAIRLGVTSSYVHMMEMGARDVSEEMGEMYLEALKQLVKERKELK
jgi:hypothetical protein